MIILNTQKTKEEENSPLLSEGMVTEWPQAVLCVSLGDDTKGMEGSGGTNS